MDARGHGAARCTSPPPPGPDRQLVLHRVVAGGPGPRDLQRRVVGHAHAEVVRLHLAVACALPLGQIVWLDLRQQPARRIARRDVGVDGVAELVRRPALHAVELLTVLGVGLAADRVAHAGGGEQVALVGRVDEKPGGHRQPAEHGDPRDPVAFHRRLVEVLAAADRHVVVGDVAVDDPLSHAGLEEPLLLLAVAGADVAVEPARQPADDVAAAVVGPAQPAGGHPAERLAGVQQHDRQAELRRGHRRDHPARRPAVDAEIGVERLVGVLDPVRIEVMQVAHGRGL